MDQLSEWFNSHLSSTQCTSSLPRNGCTFTSACTYMPAVLVYYKSHVKHFGIPAPYGSRAPVHIPQWRQGTVIDLLVRTPRGQKKHLDPRALIRSSTDLSFATLYIQAPTQSLTQHSLTVYRRIKARFWIRQRAVVLCLWAGTVTGVSKSYFEPFIGTNRKGSGQNNYFVLNGHEFAWLT